MDMDIAERLVRLKGGIEEIRTHYATKADVQEVKIQLVDLKSEMIKWMLGIQLTAMAIIVAIMLSFGNILIGYIRDVKQTATPPVTVNIPPQQAQPVPK